MVGPFFILETEQFPQRPGNRYADGKIAQELLLGHYISPQ